MGVVVNLFILIGIAYLYYNLYQQIAKSRKSLSLKSQNKANEIASQKAESFAGKEIAYCQRLAGNPGDSKPTSAESNQSRETINSQESVRLEAERVRLSEEAERLKARQRQIDQRERELEGQRVTEPRVRRLSANRSSSPSMNTGIPDIDGPGMYQRLTHFGPPGHVVYLMHSEEHGAYKVGHCPHDYLGTRLRQIRATAPDVAIAGTLHITLDKKPPKSSKTF